MVDNSRFLRTLQLISDTARKINPGTRTLPTPPTILKPLPAHKPLLPLLLSHNVPSKLASVCADRYDKYASQLRSETETKLAPYLINRGESQPSTIYSLFLDNYRHTLLDWAQSILNTALKRIRREAAELSDWDATYPPPMWLPLPLELYPTFTCKNTQTSRLLSPTSTPPHAFPTTYPPPLRPPSCLHPVAWSRTPAVSQDSPSTSAVDLDSLCSQFSKCLVIDENRTKPLQQKASIFSLPTAPTKGSGSYKKLQKGKPAESQRSPGPEKLPTTSPRKLAKRRQLSVPPSFPLYPKVRPIPRKTSSPPCVSAFKRPPTFPLSLEAAPQIALSSDGLIAHPQLDSTTLPLRPQLSPDLAPDHNSQCSSHSPTNPITPPSLFPDLPSKSAVVPSTPVDLPSGFPPHITDPLAQWHVQNDCLPSSFFTPSLDYTLGPTAYDFPPKSAFGTLFGSDNPFGGISACLTIDPSETNCFNTFAVF